MQIALVHDHYDDSHLQAVIAQMRTFGAPTIKAVWMETHGHWAALEGCHRIRAAAELGLMPIIDEIEYSNQTLADLGCDDADDGYTVEQIADDSYRATVIEFADE